MSELLFRHDRAEVWHGDCLDEGQVDTVMQGRKADLLCLDAPYSSRTHSGHKSGAMSAERALAFAERGSAGRTRERAYNARAAAKGWGRVRDIEYAAWSPATVRAFCDIWCPRTSGWVVTITDDVLAPAWRTSLQRHGLYPFAPLPLVETGSRVRMAGDGPSGWTCWIVVARPRGKEYSTWGALRGAYVVPGERKINSAEGSDRVVGGKPLLAMQCIVDDYSRRGGLVVDPCSGGGTTIRAAIGLGRRALGLEIDHGRSSLSARVAAQATQALDRQGELFAGAE